MTSDYLYEDKDAYEKANLALKRMKEYEASVKMYSWKYKDVIISYKSKERLQEAVNALGFEWNAGIYKEE